MNDDRRYKSYQNINPHKDRQNYNLTYEEETGKLYYWDAWGNRVDLNTDTPVPPTPLEPATPDTLGGIKTNPDRDITVDENGVLNVGGRLGSSDSGLGLFSPNDREPRDLGDYDFLITDAKGMSLANSRALAIVSGYTVTVRSAPAGTTEYHLTNNYANRIAAKCCENGYASRDEATSKIETVIPVVSVQIRGEDYTPDSSANASGRANDIVITTAESLNPDEAVTSIRLFGFMNAYSSAHIGNGVRTDGGGRSLFLGAGITKIGGGNEDCVVANRVYINGNGNGVFGMNHIVSGNRKLVAGEGHDTADTKDGVALLGKYAYADEHTRFAFGDGANHTTRRNLFEVLDDGGVVMLSPNGTRFKITVDDSGNLTTTQL